MKRPDRERSSCTYHRAKDLLQGQERNKQAFCGKPPIAHSGSEIKYQYKNPDSWDISEEVPRVPDLFRWFRDTSHRNTGAGAERSHGRDERRSTRS